MIDTDADRQHPTLSIVIPCHNEQDNLRPLIAAIEEALVPLKLSYEIIVTDDCSTDKSWEILKELVAQNSHIRIQRFAFNSGQSAALWAGIKAAAGQYIATIDADLQNDPKDLPLLIEGLQKFDCVCGSRVAARAQGDNFVRIISSRIANRVRNSISGDNISDSGCCFRVFKRECVADLKFFKGMHRFMPTLIKMEGFTVTEIPIRQNHRLSGKSHYNIGNRMFSSFYDLLAVSWMKKRMFKFKIAERIEAKSLELVEKR
jgi:glycosyltransferase involved in cell wall biosynthesis